MNPKYMLDTNICIYLMKHQPPEVRERFAHCFVGDVVISAVTLAELEFGIACSSTAAQETNRAALGRTDAQLVPLSLDDQFNVPGAVGKFGRNANGLRVAVLEKFGVGHR